MNLTPFLFLVAAAACYRISLLFTAESGPGRIFARLRRAPKKNSAAHDWIHCIFCFSMSGSAVVCLLLWLGGLREHWAHWPLIWCALSTVTILIHMKFKHAEP